MMNRPNNYTPYHIHSMLSNGVTNIDSITDFHKYIDKAKQEGIKSFGFAEHGSVFQWLKKKEYIESCGMKYIHATEVYLTETIQDKIRDNYHCVLIAKNYDGVKELNRITSKSFDRKDNHFYYTPRVTFNELFSTSDNIIVTSACLGGVLNNGTPTVKEMFIGFMTNNKHRCFLEIQHHNCDKQIEYNKLLYELSEETGIPLIAGTDTHEIDKKSLSGRAIMQKSKKIHFDNEDEWDLVFKTIDELITAYEEQDSLAMDVIYEAIENTNKMADMIEPFEIDYSPKYPKLYNNSEEVFKKKVNEGFIERGISNYPNKKIYIDRIRYEYEVYKHNNAIDFMLLEEDYKSAMRKQGIRYGYSRGSVSGSIIAYLLHITDIDSIKFNLNFERFMNKERVSLADIDTDWYSEDRKAVKSYLYNKKGLYCCDIITFNTIALRGTIKDVCRGLATDNIDKLPEEILSEVKAWDKQEKLAKQESSNYIKKDYPTELQKRIEDNSVHKEIPLDYLSFADEVIKIAEDNEELARKKYPELFYYVDMIHGVVISVGNHPAGCVVSPYPIDEWFGTFTTSEDEYPISQLNMKEIDSLNFVKLDILSLDNVGLIYKTCDSVGIPYATPDNTPLNDEKVWKSIKDDTTLIFQWESRTAFNYLKKLFSDETINRIKSKNRNFSYLDLLAIGNGAIRPAGASYRDELSKGDFNDCGHPTLNNMMASTQGFMVFQEQIIQFLHEFCGYSMGEADVVRRSFAKKVGTEEHIPNIKDGFIKTMYEKYSVEKDEAERIIVDFIQVIKDASDYLFSSNHSIPYSMIGYICGYLRYYYPLEFITNALNIFQNNEEKTASIVGYAKKHGIKIVPIKFRFSLRSYSFNKENNTIYKGISSIKYMNKKIADELFELRDNRYNTFIDLLYDISDKTSMDMRQLKILIELNYFSEFGDIDYLLELTRLYKKLSGKKQLKKETAIKIGVKENDIIECCENVTEKTYSKLDSKKLLHRLAGSIHVKKRSLKEMIQSQIEYLGYIDIADEQYKRMLVVLSMNTKYSPRLECYSLKNGTTIHCKISKRIFNENKIKKSDIIKVKEYKIKEKIKRTAEGDFVNIPGTSEIWLTDYEKM